MISGILLAVLTYLLWGATFITTYFIPDYPGIYVGLGRAVLIGLFSLIVFAVFPNRFKRLSTADWKAAFVLSVFGQLLQPICFFFSVIYAGTAISSVCFGICPVLIALISNSQAKQKGEAYVNATSLILPLLLICFGFIFCNITEFLYVDDNKRAVEDTLIGLAFGISSSGFLTFYSIKNAQWLKINRRVGSTEWFSAQCITLLPLAATLYVSTCWFDPSMPNLLGPQPELFTIVMFLLAMFGSFLPGITFNMAAARIPTSLLGQLITLETFFGIVFGQLVQRAWPSGLLSTGLGFFLVGVIASLYIFSKPQGSVRLDSKKSFQRN